MENVNGKEVWRNGKSVSLLMLLLVNYLTFSFKVFLKKIWTILKVFIEFVTMLLLFYVGQEACGILALPPGIQPTPPWVRRRSIPLDCQGSPRKLLDLREKPCACWEELSCRDVQGLSAAQW